MNVQTANRHSQTARYSVPLPTKRGLSREEAAGYIGTSTSKFDEMVNDGRMPTAKQIDGRRVWDVRQLDTFFDRLPGSDCQPDNPWDN